MPCAVERARHGQLRQNLHSLQTIRTCPIFLSVFLSLPSLHVSQSCQSLFVNAQCRRRRASAACRSWAESRTADWTTPRSQQRAFSPDPDLIESHQPDVLVITETWMNADQPPAVVNDIAPSDYSVVHQFRGARSGGSWRRCDSVPSYRLKLSSLRSRVSLALLILPSLYHSPTLTSHPLLLRSSTWKWSSPLRTVYQLPERTTLLKDKNYIMRMLYKDWLITYHTFTYIFPCKLDSVLSVILLNFMLCCTDRLRRRRIEPACSGHYRPITSLQVLDKKRHLKFDEVCRKTEKNMTGKRQFYLAWTWLTCMDLRSSCKLLSIICCNFSTH